MLTVGSLFSGIGGLEKGLEDTGGFKTVWQVECDPFAQAVLRKHWPDVGRWDDVRTLPPAPAEDWKCDVICGGPPCQPASHAGLRRGQRDARWLWPDTLRIIRTLRPRIAVLENPPALLDLDNGERFGEILGALAESGYDTEWQCIPASAVGAPHRRERVFIVAYTDKEGQSQLQRSEQDKRRRVSHGGVAAIARNAQCGRLQSRIFRFSEQTAEVAPSGRCTSLGTYVGEAWDAEPSESWMDDGIPCGLAEVYSRLLGNAVVPAVASWIGHRIIEAID